MQNSELSDIESSVQILVRRAYELGRNDVLKRVVDVLKTDQPNAEPRALSGPRRDQVTPRELPAPQREAVSHEPAEPQSQEAETQPAPAETERRPWWAVPAR